MWRWWRPTQECQRGRKRLMGREGDGFQVKGSSCCDVVGVGSRVHRWGRQGCRCEWRGSSFGERFGCDDEHVWFVRAEIMTWYVRLVTWTPHGPAPASAQMLIKPQMCRDWAIVASSYRTVPGANTNLGYKKNAFRCAASWPCSKGRMKLRLPEVITIGETSVHFRYNIP